MNRKASQRFFNLTSAINAVVNDNDDASFEFIFDYFYDRLYRVALFYLKRDSYAEDAISEVFMKLWINKKKLKKVENLEKYLFTMCKNQCLYMIRSDKKVQYDEALLKFHQQIVIDTPESDLISNEFISFFNESVNKLPPKCRIVYLMVKDDGLKYKEVASILNISVKTVENQMTKAIAHIRNSINIYQSASSSLDFNNKI